MLTTLAALLPVCYFVVATDAPNPSAIFVHEQAHCWGWVHAENLGTRLTKSYKAHMPTGRWLKPYPKDRLEVYYDTMRNVRKTCGSNEPFGCQWGGLQD